MKYTNKFNLPPSLVDAIIGQTYDPSDGDPKRIGITTLIGSPRVRLLTTRHWKELEEDVADHIWRITGSAYHYILAKIDEKNRMIEEKFIEKVDDYTIVGKLDNYEHLTHTIEDYKVTSVWAVKLGVKEDWIEQLNCYAWLLRKAGHEVKDMFINAILRDWRRGEQKKYDDYPPIPFMRLKIKLWTFEEQEAFVKERVALYKEAQAIENDNELPLCSAKERWAKDDTYAVMKNSNKTATRVLECAKKADEYIEYITGVDKKKGQTHSYKVVKRDGGDLRCTDYCLVAQKCSYYKEKYGG